MIMISSPAGRWLAKAKAAADIAEAEFSRIDSGRYNNEAEKFHWMLRGRMEAYEPAREAWNEFILAANAVADELTAHVRDILDRGGIIMTLQGPLGPADVERLTLGGMTREQAIKAVYGGEHEDD